jgi:Neurotransmitter-gated ion-channel ligand binding domain
LDQYGNTHFLVFSSGEVLWVPPAKLKINKKTTFVQLDQYGNTHFLVFSSGEVLWVPPAKFKSFCKVKTTLFEIIFNPISDPCRNQIKEYK